MVAHRNLTISLNRQYVKIVSLAIPMRHKVTLVQGNLLRLRIT